MSEGLRGVVVCHGTLARGLVDAVEQISGITGVLVPVSNTGCDRGTLEQRVTDAIAGMPSLVFVDMPSGSCLFAVMRDVKDAASVRVVTGVNLAMLIDFVFHRDESPDEAAHRAETTGRGAIRTP